MSTIKDVAKIAGVSIATVSRVVNKGPKVGHKTREKVLRVMQDIGYTPDANARALVTKKNTTLGVIVPEITDPFFALLASGVEKVAREKKMQLLLSTSAVSYEAEKDALELLIERRCQAIVFHSKKLPEDELKGYINKIPGLVIIDRLIPGAEEHCFWLDNKEGGRIAARYLVALRHESFALINSHYPIEDPILRLAGFSEAIRDHGYNLEKELVIANEPTLKGGELAAHELLAKSIPFSALFAYNDAMAIGAISTLEDNGYAVPEDISVIGCDDVLLSRYSRPKLTTLHYPVKEMASAAAEAAISFGMKQTSKQSLNKYLPHLVKRESTAKFNLT